MPAKNASASAVSDAYPASIEQASRFAPFVRSLAHANTVESANFTDQASAQEPALEIPSMLGTFRLFLALCVALSHANVQIAGLNPGVIAVVCFYLISGYVMTGLLRSHFPGRAHIGHFYLDRALRLMPQYLLIAGLTLILYLVAKPATPFLAHAPALSDLLNNLLVVPLNWYMFNHSDSFTLIPPAWSLGAELQFYLLMPLLLLWRLRTFAFALGLLVYLLAAWGMIDTNIYGYRLLPGVLTFFMLGSVLHDVRREDANKSRLIVGAAVLGCAACALVLWRFDHLSLLYNRETLLGVALGLPILLWLTRQSPKAQQKSAGANDRRIGPPRPWLDSRLGDLSYGVFLNHFLIQWSLTGVPSTPMGWAMYLSAIVALSAFTQWLVERPVLALRRHLRQRQAVQV